MVSIRGNSETRDDAVQNARSRPAKQPILQAGGRKKGRQIYHNAPLYALTKQTFITVSFLIFLTIQLHWFYCGILHNQDVGKVDHMQPR